MNLDYVPPTDTYLIEAGEDRGCLQLTILDDSIFEGPEDLTGTLEGIVNDLGQLVRNPDRINFNPAMTTIQIDDNDGTYYYLKIPLVTYPTLLSIHCSYILLTLLHNNYYVQHEV